MVLRRTRVHGDHEPDVVIDLTERLAVYEDAAPRPGWRDDLIAEDQLRHKRPVLRGRRPGTLAR